MGFDVGDEIEMSHPEMCREHCLKSNASHFEYLLPNLEQRVGSCKCKTSDEGHVPLEGNE